MNHCGYGGGTLLWKHSSFQPTELFGGRGNHNPNSTSLSLNSCLLSPVAQAQNEARRRNVSLLQSTIVSIPGWKKQVKRVESESEGYMESTQQRQPGN